MRIAIIACHHASFGACTHFVMSVLSANTTYVAHTITFHCVFVILLCVREFSGWLLGPAQADPPVRPISPSRSLAWASYCASASYCAECHSVPLPATPSAPSPQSGFTDNEFWCGPYARRLLPWTGRTVLDVPTTHQSLRP
jgi:hypothetical protein